MVVGRLLRFFRENKVLKKYDYPPKSIIRDPKCHLFLCLILTIVAQFFGHYVWNKYF